MADASRLQERTERWECGVRCIWLDERIYRTRITRAGNEPGGLWARNSFGIVCAEGGPFAPGFAFLCSNGGSMNYAMLCYAMLCYAMLW